ncbi:capsule biosynthesis protein [Actinomadura rubrobrunea]|uniref:Capsule biosynthesis protein n=1 Tax=Actinomadura rubrobrunea TaxID=115335 RepID=A0A9W6PTP8_9ACTN|nr:CapA family protein [Actinomadura rubrobrunea]GLW62904.1 capsule biosynthesis protein [Actinomadura rubrobrunea]
MAVTMALAGDTMLGRGVADRLAEAGPHALFSDGVREAVAQADLAVLNLECCVSARGRPWPAPGKPFHFRAPPAAAEALAGLGVDCVNLANNHALDYGADALADTLDHLAAAGIRAVGAGEDEAHARAPAFLRAGDARVAVIGVTDHPADFAAGRDRPGVAYADLPAGTPRRLVDQVRALRERADAVLVMTHWGPNMVTEPLRYVRRAAGALTGAGATLVAGTSAHVFQGAAGRVLFDLGDFIDDYVVDRLLRNDLGLLFLVTLERPDPRGTLEPARLEAVPLRLCFAHTRLAAGADREWIRRRFTAACREFGTPVEEEDGRLVARMG